MILLTRLTRDYQRSQLNPVTLTGRTMVADHKHLFGHAGEHFGVEQRGRTSEDKPI